MPAHRQGIQRRHGHRRSLAERHHQSRLTPRARPVRGLPDPPGDTETGGGALAVSDDEMVDAMYRLATSEGIIACPEGAATLVGLERLLADGSIGADEEVVLLNTGSGYKYLDLLRGRGRHSAW